MASNIEIAAQLNKLLTVQNQLYLTQAKIQRGQLAVTQQIVNVLQETDLDKMVERSAALVEQMNAADAALQKMGNSGQRAGDQINNVSSDAKKKLIDLADATEGVAKKFDRLAVFSSAFQGAVRGFELSFNILTSISGILGQVASTMFRFSKAVLAFPLTIWNFLFEKATSGGGGGDLRQTLENIRKEFGDLERGSSKAIVSMAKGMSGQLANTGLSVYRTFGNLAERLKTVAELAKALGPLFITVFQQGMIKNIEAVGAFQKGLGLSNEQMKVVARTAILTGTSIDESLRETANYAIQLGDAFGMNAMEISRDMAELETDMTHFGNLTKKELAETAVYAKKLGVEIKGLTGILDTFANLDGATQAVARLNQQFGIQLDTIGLMKKSAAGDVNGIFNEMQQGIRQAGVSFENMDRLSKKYFADTLGMSVEDAAMAFRKGAGGLDEIRKKSGEAQKSQLSQAEAMQKLAGSIERLIKSGGGGAKTLFGAFAEGFERAIFRSTEFRQIMRSIRRILRATKWAGYEVGKAFVDMFPGVKQILGGMVELFSVQRWQKTLGGVVNAFKAFFKDLQTNPEAGLKNLYERLKKTFFDHFNAGTPAGLKLVEGFKKFFIAIFQAIIGGLKAFVPMAMQAMTKLINGINSVLKGEGNASLDVNSLWGQIMKTLSGLWEAIKPAAIELWAALKSLLETVLTKVKGFLEEHRTAIVMFFFGPAFIRALIGAGTAAFVQGITVAVTNAMKSGTVKNVLGKASTALAKGTKGTSGIGGGVFSIEEMKIITEQVSGAAKASSKTSGAMLREFGAKLLIIAAVLAVGGIAMALAVKAMVAILNGVSVEDVIKSGVVLVAMAVGMSALGLSVKLLKDVNPGEAGKAAIGTLALAALAVVMAGGFRLIVAMFSGVEMGDVTVTVAAMVGAAIIFTAAAGLAFAGAGIAALATSVGGLGAVAIIAGVAFIGVVVAGMVAGILGIIEAVKSVNIGGDAETFKVKIDAFVNVFKAVVGFAAVFSAIAAAGAIAALSSMITLLSPVGVIASLFGIGPGASNPMSTLVEIIQAISGTITSLISELAKMQFTPDQIKGIGAIGTIITAIAGLAESMKLPEGFASGFFTNDDANLRFMTTWFQNMQSILAGPNGLLAKAQTVVAALSSIPMVNPETVKATGEIFQSIVGLTAALKMDPEYLKLLQQIGSERNAGTISALALNNISRNTEGVIQIIEAVKDNIPLILGSIIAITSLYTPGQLKRAASGASIVGAVIEVVTNLLNSVRSAGLSRSLAGAGENMRELENFDAGTFGSVMVSVGSLVQTIFGNGALLQTIVTAINNSGIGTLEKGIGEKIGAIGSVIQAIAQLGSPEVQDAFRAVGVIGMGGGNINGPALQNLLGGLSLGISAINVSKGQINQVKNFGEAISSIGNVFGTLDSVFSKAVEQAAQFGTIRTAIFGEGGIVSSVRSIINELNAIEPVNISTGLRKLAGTMELGGSEQLTINHKNFTLEVNLTVTLDAETIERAIVSNPRGTLVLTRTDGPPGAGRTRGRG